MLWTLLVEPDELFRRTFEDFLNAQAEIGCVGTAADSSSALTLCQALRPDVVVLEIFLPEEDGVDLLCAIRQQFPETTIIIFSSYLEDYVEAMRSGVTTWVMKGAGPYELVKAILQYSTEQVPELEHGRI